LKNSSFAGAKHIPAIPSFSTQTKSTIESNVLLPQTSPYITTSQGTLSEELSALGFVWESEGVERMEGDNSISKCDYPNFRVAFSIPSNPINIFV
jgi:hypothetical protein